MDSLTHAEIAALSRQWNLADGHAKQELHRGLQAVVEDLPRIFAHASEKPQSELEDAFLEAYFGIAGQELDRIRRHSIHLHYASSIAILSVGMMLKESGRLRCGLIHPTFDNIAGLLSRSGLQLVPVMEEILTGNLAELKDLGLDALFAVSPNNPTGLAFSVDGFDETAAWCAATGTLLVLDTSFRFFGDAHLWDQYSRLEAQGGEYVVIEDTGKTWPSLDVKIGFIVASPGLETVIRPLTEDISLGPSPLALALLTAMINADREAAVFSGRPSVRSLVTSNRNTLRDHLAAAPVTPFNAQSTISVEWLRLGARVLGQSLCDKLAQHGVGVLHGPQFFWADPILGESYIRVALSRPSHVIRDAAPVLAREIRDAVR